MKNFWAELVIKFHFSKPPFERVVKWLHEIRVESSSVALLRFVSYFLSSSYPCSNSCPFFSGKFETTLKSLQDGDLF